MNRLPEKKPDKFYRVRILANIVLVELILIGLFKFWPNIKSTSHLPDITVSEHPIVLQDMTITRQGGVPPMPPVPAVPIPVPNDQIIQDPIPDLNISNILKLDGLPGNNGSGGQGGGSGNIVKHPNQPPSVVKIVEPAVPSAAKKANIKVEIVVNFLVDTDGKVDKATITQIKLYSNNLKSYQIVKHIGYGIPQATIDAAMQWRFRPAQQNGKSVRAYTKHIFTFGI